MIKLENRAFFRAMGKRVSKHRKECGMTQAELARALGVSQQTVFSIELGDRRVSAFNLMKLASIFQTPVEQLMGIAPPSRRRRLSPAGIRHAECLAQLSKTQQRIVTGIIDTLLTREPRQQTNAKTGRGKQAGRENRAGSSEGHADPP